MMAVVTGAAVSGGADSVYLLHHLIQQGLRPTVLHVNHALRGAESDADERFVRDLAASLQLDILVHHAPIPNTGNLEQHARRARLDWFRELVETGVVTKVALGHTRSDQAETVLFRILRGAGTAGLAGIRPETAILTRPILHLTREQVRASLHQRGIPWREDSSNSALHFARNRIRLELLPQLTRDWNPNISENLAQMADWARDEESYWARRISRLAQRYLTANSDNSVVLRMAKLPPAAGRRLLRHAIQLVKGDLLGIDFSHIETLRALRSGRAALPGLDAERSFDWLRLTPAGEFNRPVHPNVSWELRAANEVYNRDRHQLDWGRVSGPLRLRCWQNGDRYFRVGRPREERLKLLFQKARIPVWERRNWPVLTSGDGIVWTREFGVAQGLECTSETQTVLLVRDLTGFPNRMPSSLRHSK